MPGKPFRIRKQLPDGETLSTPSTNSCRACYTPLPHTKDAYCSPEHMAIHHLLTRRRVFACEIAETAA